MTRDVARMIAALVITVIIVSATIGGTIALTSILSPAPVDLPTVPPPLTLTPGQAVAMSTHTSTASATEMPRPTATATSPPTSTHTPTPTDTPTFTPAPPDPCSDPAAFRAAVLTEQPRLVPPLGTFVSDREQILVATWTVENRGTCSWKAMRLVFDRVSQTPAPSAPPQLLERSDATETLIRPRQQAQVVLLVAAHEVADRALDWRWAIQVAGPQGNWVSLPEKLRLQTSHAWVSLGAVPAAQISPEAVLSPTITATVPAAAEITEPTVLAMRPTEVMPTPASTFTPTASARGNLPPTVTALPQPITPALTPTRVSSPVAVAATPVVPARTTIPATWPAPPPPPTATPLPPPAPPRLIRPRPPDNLENFAGEETFIGYDATIEFQWAQDGRPLQPDEHYVIAITHKRGVEYRWAGQTAYYHPPPTQEGFMGWLVDFTDPVGRLWWKILIVKTRRTDLVGPPSPDDVILAESVLGTFRWVKPGGPEREKGPSGGID